MYLARVRHACATPLEVPTPVILGTFQPFVDPSSTARSATGWVPSATICAGRTVDQMKRQWTRDELADHWTLAPKELELLANKTGATRLGFAVLLKAFRVEGRFPRQKHDVPGVVIVHVANQVNVAADLYPSYEWSGRTIEYGP